MAELQSFITAKTERVDVKTALEKYAKDNEQVWKPLQDEMNAYYGY